jgi:hypothetical protein
MRVEKIIVPEGWNPDCSKAINKWFNKISKITKYDTRKPKNK